MTPNTYSWERFFKYARRVRHLHHSQLHWRQLDKRAFLEIAETRPQNQDILPNIHTFMWEDDPQFSVMFMHGRITHYTMSLPDHLEPLPVVTTLFPKIIQYMPNLASLHIQTEETISTIETQMLQLLTALPKLKNITLPHFHFTTKIAMCLSRHTDLSRIDFEDWERCTRGNPKDTRVFDPSLNEGAFPALKELSFMASFQDAQRFLQMLMTPSQLKTLRIQSQELETQEDFQRVIAWVADKCPGIQVLSLGSLFLPNHSIASNHTAATERISIHTIKPLFRNNVLTSLTLDHQYPLNLNHVDLEEISMAWPMIDTLVLNPTPGHFAKSDLTVNALAPFARNCENLCELGLFIDATDQENLRSSERTRFRRLEILDVGLSAIEHEEPIAQFLRNILPSNHRRCIWSELDWESPITSADETTKRTALTRMDRWEKVHWLL